MYKKILFLLVLALATGAKAQEFSLEPKQDDKKPLWGYVNRSNGKWVVKPTYNLAEPFKTGADGKPRALVTKGNLQGYIGSDGKPLGAGIVFESIEPTMEGPNMIVAVKGMKGIIDPDGVYLQKPEISEIQPLGSEGYIIKVKGKKGFLSPEGKSVIEPVYSDIKTSEEDVFIVYKGGKAGLLSRQGEMLLAPDKYSDVIKFGDNWKIKKGDKVGLFDSKQRALLVAPDYTDVMEPFTYSGGTLYPVRKKKDKWGALGADGKEIISFKNQTLTPLRPLDAVRLNRNKVGDRLFIPAEKLYLELSSYNEKQQGPFKIINLTVAEPSEKTPRNIFAGLSSSECYNYDKNYKERMDAYRKLGPESSFQIVVDRQGKFRGPDARVNSLGNNWLVSRSKGPWVVYDLYGEQSDFIKFNGPIDASSPTGDWFSDGRSIIFSDLSVYFYIDCGDQLKFISKERDKWYPMVNNTPNFSESYDMVAGGGYNYAMVKKGEKWGLFSKKLIVPCEYDSFKDINRNAWLEVRIDDFVGLFDLKTEKWILSPDNKIKSYEFYNSDSNSPILIYNGNWGLANSKGQITMPMTSTKEAVLKSLQPKKPKPEPSNNQSKQKKQQTVKETNKSTKRSTGTDFQESKEKRRF